MIITGERANGSGETLVSRGSTTTIAIGGKSWHQKSRRSTVSVKDTPNDRRHFAAAVSGGIRWRIDIPSG